MSVLYTEEIYSVPTPVTLVLPQSWSQVSTEEKTLLAKILQGVGHSLEKVRVLHLPEFDLSSWGERPQKILSFMDPPKGLAGFEIVTAGETSVIFCGPLEKLSVTPEENKRKLWESIKSLLQFQKTKMA